MNDNKTKNDRLSEVVAREAFHWGDNAASHYHEIAALHMEAQWNNIIFCPILRDYQIDMSETINSHVGGGATRAS